MTEGDKMNRQIEIFKGYPYENRHKRNVVINGRIYLNVSKSSLHRIRSLNWVERYYSIAREREIIVC